MDQETCHKILNMGPRKLGTPPMQIGPRMCPVDTKVSNIQTLREMGVDGRKSGVVSCDLAFPWGMEEFLFSGLGAGHPLQEPPTLPDHQPVSAAVVAGCPSADLRAAINRQRRRLTSVPAAAWMWCLDG